MIRPANKDDAAVIVQIYNYYILNTVITFEEVAISAEEMARRIDEITMQNLPWLAAVIDEQVCGYAYASKWRERSAYRFSTEITVYLSPNQCRRGLGSQLYAVLLPELKNRGIHSVVGGITLPNPASVALHEKFGMKQVAQFDEIGYKFGQWQQVGYWQKIL